MPKSLTFVDELMSSADEIEVVPVHEVGRDLGAEQPSGSTGTDRPSVDVLRVRPDKVAKCT